jgi:hypothetical protein
MYGEDDRPDWGDEEMGSRRRMFKDPGGKSALRAASNRNPRNLPCPQCHAENVLTPADRAQGYVCDRCADAAEGYGY